MQVTINIDESQLKEVMEEQLKALDPEALQEIFVQAVGEYFRQNDYKNIQQIIFTSSGYYSDRRLSPTVEKALANADYSKLQDIVDASIDLLKTKYTDLLLGALSTFLVGGMTNSYTFQTAMNGIALHHINDLKQELQGNRYGN